VFFIENENLIKFQVENTIRWRNAKDEAGRAIKESINDRFQSFITFRK
jgi:hypothetical protein